jgi:hypothetical protein
MTTHDQFFQGLFFNPKKKGHAQKFSRLATVTTPLRYIHVSRKQGASAFVFSALDGEKARLFAFEPPTVMIFSLARPLWTHRQSLHQKQTLCTGMFGARNAMV